MRPALAALASLLLGCGAGDLIESTSTTQREFEDEPEVLRALAFRYVKQERWSDAAQAFEKAFANGLINVNARSQLAVLYLDHLDEPAKAVSHLERLLRWHDAVLTEEERLGVVLLLAEAQARSGNRSALEDTLSPWLEHEIHGDAARATWMAWDSDCPTIKSLAADLGDTTLLSGAAWLNLAKCETGLRQLDTLAEAFRDPASFEAAYLIWAERIRAWIDAAAASDELLAHLRRVVPALLDSDPFSWVMLGYAAAANRATESLLDACQFFSESPSDLDVYRESVNYLFSLCSAIPPQ